MSYNHIDPPRCCENSTAEVSDKSSQLKLYQFFMFCVPILFTFILLFFFYLFYLRPRRVNWSSLRMLTVSENEEDISRVELGLKKEIREMLPIIVYKESFSVRDTQCSVCLGDYQAEDRLQQIPACHHTFHVDCIDHWLSTHTTCPLCRLSLLPLAKSQPELPEVQVEVSQVTSVGEDHSETPLEQRPQVNEHLSTLNTREPKLAQNNDEEDHARRSQCIDCQRETRGESETTCISIVMDFQHDRNPT